MEEAHETADLALAYARKYGVQDILAKTLANAFTYFQLVDISRAVKLIEESIEILDQLGEHNLKATSMINLGYIYTQSGFFQRGEETFKRSFGSDVFWNTEFSAKTQANRLANFVTELTGANVNTILPIFTAVLDGIVPLHLSIYCRVRPSELNTLKTIPLSTSST